MKKEILVILDNIRSVYNVGSIFRTSDALNISKIFLCGYTPAPVDRFGRKRSDFTKSSLGAESYVKWEKAGDAVNLISNLKKKGVFIVAVEQSEKSIDYKKVKHQQPTAFIFGNEVSGLPKEILSLCDVVAEIPMKGSKESLNVSVSFGVALFRILDV